MLTGGITTELWPLAEEEGGWARLVPRMLTLLRVRLICKVPVVLELLEAWPDVEVAPALLVAPASPPVWIRAVCWREQAWIDEACWRKIGGTLDLGPPPATARNWSEAVELSTYPTTPGTPTPRPEPGLELVLTVAATAVEAMVVVVEVAEEEGGDDELELLRSGEPRLGPLS